MRKLAGLLVALLFCEVAAAQVSVDEAYRRLAERLEARAGSTHPAALAVRQADAAREESVELLAIEARRKTAAWVPRLAMARGRGENYGQSTDPQIRIWWPYSGGIFPSYYGSGSYYYGYRSYYGWGDGCYSGYRQAYRGHYRRY